MAVSAFHWANEAKQYGFDYTVSVFEIAFVDATCPACFKFFYISQSFKFLPIDSDHNVLVINNSMSCGIVKLIISFEAQSFGRNVETFPTELAKERFITLRRSIYIRPR